MQRRIRRIPAAILASAAIAGLGGPALASELDFATLTCATFLKQTDEGQAVIALWLDGHLSPVTDPARVELDQVRQIAPALRADCEDRRDSKLTSVYELRAAQWVASRPQPGDRASQADDRAQQAND